MHLILYENENVSYHINLRTTGNVSILHKIKFIGSVTYVFKKNEQFNENTVWTIEKVKEALSLLFGYDESINVGFIRFKKKIVYQRGNDKFNLGDALDEIEDSEFIKFYFNTEE